MLESKETSNIENTIEEKDVVSENIGKILLEEEIEETEVEDKKEFKTNGCIKELLVGIVDQIVVMAVALITLLVFNLILKIFGYYVSEKQPMFLIIYIIINIIYVPICKKIKLKETVGRKVLLNK